MQLLKNKQEPASPRDPHPGPAAGTDPDLVRIDSVSHRYEVDGRIDPTSPLVVRDVNLTAQRGEFISIVGPSGCGKSTLLTLLSGLERPETGTVAISGVKVNQPRRDVGFVFQKDALLPWKSLRENVGLALRYRKVAKQEAQERAQSWLDRFGIGDLGDRFPHQVSGGQRKRASIAATMVYEPQIMLMDEPFASLDVQTRDFIETDILKIWGERRDQTVIFVTHDLEEAVALSDRVVVMSRGPAHVIGDHAIDLPRPRGIREIRSTEAFAAHCADIWAELKNEVRAVQRQTDVPS